MVGERSEQTHQTEVLALGMVTGAAVGDLTTDAHQGTKVAEVLVTGRAARASAAGRDEPEHDVVTGGQPADALADLLDHAGTLVATDDRQLEREISRHEMLVGVTHPGCGQFDQHFAGLRVVELDLLDAPR